MAESSDRDATDRNQAPRIGLWKSIHCDRWSVAIVVVTTLIVGVFNFLWLYGGGVGTLIYHLDAAGLVSRGGWFGLVTNPLARVDVELKIAAIVGLLAGIDVAIVRVLLVRRALVASATPRAAVTAVGAILTSLAVAIAGAALAIGLVWLPSVRALVTSVGVDTQVVRLVTHPIVLWAVAIAGAIAPHAGLWATVRAWRRRSAGTDTAL